VRSSLGAWSGVGVTAGPLSQPWRLRLGGGCGGAGSGGFSPLGCRAPASPARTGAWLPLSVVWLGGLSCPWTRGTVDAVARQETSGASGGANEVGHARRLPAIGRLGCRVGWWGACGWGSGMPGTVRPDPSTLGVVGERGSHQGSCLRLVPGSAGQESTRYTAVASSPRLVLGHWRPSGSVASAARTWRSSSSVPFPSSRASSSSQVASSNRSTRRLAPSLSRTARWRVLAGRVPVTAWLAAWGSAAATQ
jgi:hypothetical protein